MRTVFYLAVGGTAILATIFVVWNVGWLELEGQKIQEMENATSSDPFMLAEYYFNSDDDPAGPYDLKKARHYYEQAIVASSTAHIAAWYQLGRIDFLEGKFDAAIYKFNKQIEYFGDLLPQVRYMLGLTYAYKAQISEEDEDWERGVEEFKKFLVHKPDSPWARTDLSWAYFSLGEYEEMLPVLEAGLSYTPESPWLHNMYGLALFNLGETEQAHEHFLKASTFVQDLTPHDWGLAYPGNDPGSWEMGLNSFIDVIEYNLSLAQND